MEITVTFGERLKELIEDKYGSTRAFTAAAGFAKSSVNAWISGQRAVRRAQLIRLADTFGCSIEYLTGRSDTFLDYAPKPCPPFYGRLKELLEENGLSFCRLMRETGMYDSYLTNWKRGADPDIRTLAKLADGIGCTVDCLVGRDR